MEVKFSRKQGDGCLLRYSYLNMNYICETNKSTPS